MIKIHRAGLQTPQAPGAVRIGPILCPFTGEPFRDRPRIEQVTTDLNVSFEAKVTWTQGSLARLMHLTCEAQLDRLDRIEALLGGDLSAADDRRDVTMQLAQFGDYEPGDRLPFFVDTVAAAQDFTRRVLPGCVLGLRTDNVRPVEVHLKPPADRRLSMEEQTTTVHVAVEPVEGANATAVALLRAAVHVIRAIVRSDLAKYAANVAPAGQEG